MKVKTRFAPSPTGLLHVGSVYGALLDYAFARKNKGEFILRVEDTDRKRYVDGAEKVIFRALKWLGLDYSSLHYQSRRLKIYRKYAEQLIENGHAYYCFCSREKLEKEREECRERKKPPMYSGCCRDVDLEKARKRIKKGEKYVIRMKIPDDEKIVVEDLIRGQVVFDSCLIDDQVLLKADGFPTYHLASTVDDHLMKISHVIRGEEWLPSAPKHVLLYRYFGWQMPIFVHTPTLRDTNKAKLSKRKGHTSIFWFKEKGFLPEAVINFLAQLGWTHPQEKEIFSFDEFIKHFDLKDLSPVGPVFDLVKLEWMNSEYIRRKKNSELVDLLRPFLPEMTKRQVKIAVPLIKERIKKLSDARELLEFAWSCSLKSKKLLLSKSSSKDEAREMLEKTVDLISAIGIVNIGKLQEKLLVLVKENDWNTSIFFMVLRVAICARPITPPILESLPLIGEKETLKRLELAIGLLS